MLSFPFNSSTPVVYWNKDAFKKAGLDPEKPPVTWPETFEAAKKLRAAGVACGFTSAWVSWVQIENFSAWHNLPIATKANGLGGPDTVLEFNNPTVTRHIANLAEAEKDKSFDYGGRDNPAGAQVHQRRLRHDPGFVGRLRHVQEQRQVRLGRAPSCPITPTSPARRRTRSSAARACG